MTTLTQRVPVDEITARGRQASLGRVLATLILGFFYLIGWMTGKTWYGLADCFVAVRVGYRQGRGLAPLEPPPPPE